MKSPVCTETNPREVLASSPSRLTAIKVVLSLTSALCSTEMRSLD